MKRRLFLKASLAGISALGRFPNSLAAVAVENASGELLYNGIQLPLPWPPHPSHPSGKTDKLPPHLALPPAIIPIDIGRQLFVDDFLIEHTTLQRSLHRPEWHAANPVLKPDKPWERQSSPPTAAPFSDGVWWDSKDSLFKLWYMAGHRHATCLAISKDAIAWQKCDLGVVPGTNIVHSGDRDSASVWLDPEEPDPQRRFRLYRTHREEIGGKGEWRFQIHLSADGVHWSDTTGTTNTIYPRSTVFWNPFRKVWVFGLRKDSSTAVGRCRRYFECPEGVSDATKQATEYSWWAAADALDLLREDTRSQPQLTNLDCVAYESVILGLFTIFRGAADPATGRPELNDVCIGFSRDGFHFERPDRKPFLAMSEKANAWNWGNVQSAGGGCLIVGDKLHFYASGRSAPSPEAPEGEVSTGVATLRRDGFASMDAGQTDGTLTTRLLKFTGKHLFVNLSAPAGEFRVEVLSENGEVIAPFTLEKCMPLIGDFTKQRVRWNGVADLGSLTGRALKFRFTLRNGKLYAFWTSSSELGQSGGYLAAGGPGFSKATDD